MEITGTNHALLIQQAAAQASDNGIMQMDWERIRGDDAALMAAAKEFEVYFIQTMFRAMRETVNTENSLFPRSQTEEIFQDMLDEQTARAAVTGGNGVGLAQQIFNQMSAGSAVIQQDLIGNGYYGRAEANTRHDEGL